MAIIILNDFCHIVSENKKYFLSSPLSDLTKTTSPVQAELGSWQTIELNLTPKTD